MEPTNEAELREAVSKALIIMAEVLANPKDPTNPALVRGWVLVLASAGVAAEEVPAGVARLLQTEKFFPTPADFLKAVKPTEDKEAAEELAWQSILAAVRGFGPNASVCLSDFHEDGCALWALDRMGWDRICRELTEENRAIWRAEFVRVYRAGKLSGGRLEYIAGRMERENALHGREVKPGLLGAMVGRPEWKALPTGHRAPALPSGEQWETMDGTELASLKSSLRPAPAEEEPVGELAEVA